MHDSAKPESKKSRAERRAINAAKALAVQVAEVAAASGEPPTLAALRQGELEARRAVASGRRYSAIGRPPEYTEAQADSLCAWVAAGGSLRGWCRENGRGVETVYRWLRQDAGFQARYAQAHEDRADTLTDEMIDIADEAARMPTIEGVSAAKLRVETRRWIASKLKPGRWGDHQTVTHSGAVSIRIGIPQREAVTLAVDEVQPTPLLP